MREHEREKAITAAAAAALLAAGLLLREPAGMPRLAPGPRRPGAPAAAAAKRAAIGAAVEKARTAGTRPAAEGLRDAVASESDPGPRPALRKTPMGEFFFPGRRGGAAADDAGEGREDDAATASSAGAKPGAAAARAVSRTGGRTTRRARVRAASAAVEWEEEHEDDDSRAKGKAQTSARTRRAERAAPDERRRAAEADARAPRAAAAPGRRRRRPFALFDAPAPAAREPRSAKGPRPPKLSRLLGGRPFKPPEPSLEEPDLAGLAALRPAVMPGGSTVPSGAWPLARLEALDPGPAPPDRRKPPHWDEASWHAGRAEGRAEDASWLWLWREKRRAWALLEPGTPPYLRHGQLWWSRRKGAWFAAHEGSLWAWRRFDELDAAGLIRLVDGARILYSSDFRRAAVMTPGEGAVLYDVATGAQLGRWREDELPRPRRPRPPDSLSLPEGI